MIENYEKMEKIMDFSGIPDGFAILCTRTINILSKQEETLRTVVTECISYDKGKTFSREKFISSDVEALYELPANETMMIDDNFKSIIIKQYNENQKTIKEEVYSKITYKKIKEINYTYNVNGDILSKKEVRFHKNYPKGYEFDDDEKFKEKSIYYEYTNSKKNIREINIYGDNKLISREKFTYKQLKDEVIQFKSDFTVGEGYESIAENYLFNNDKEDFLGKNLLNIGSEKYPNYITGGYNLVCKVQGNTYICEDYMVLHKDSVILKMK